jgi:type IV pilus assembly protein PilQ
LSVPPPGVRFATVRFTCTLACLLALSCAQELPAPASPTANAPSPSPSPFPDSAFRDDAPPRSPQRPDRPDHYETRRIGAAPAPSARYHGAPVDLDLKSADLANVFRLLADVGHVNIVVSGDVTGTITLRLKHVPWDQALEVVARARDLDLEQDGNVIVVRTAGKH